MNDFLKIGSFLFHPLWMPLTGVIFYFSYTPSFYEVSFKQYLILVIAILTILLPLLFLIAMKYFDLVSSIHLTNVNERKIPILFFTCIAAMIINTVVDVYQTEYLYYFFSAIFFSGIIASILILLKFKLSLHMLGVSGLVSFAFIFMYLLGDVNLYVLGFCFIALGWTATSRLHLKAHSFLELMIGAIVGILPQFYFYQAVFG